MTEVEKGFVSTAVEHELANPKPHGNPVVTHQSAKGNPVTIPEPVEYPFAPA